MKYQIEENCLTIFLPKELDHHQTEEIRREADRQIERNHVKYVIFDFGETSFMDSSGIGVMMGRYRKLSLTGGEVWHRYQAKGSNDFFITTLLFQF